MTSTWDGRCVALCGRLPDSGPLCRPCARKRRHRQRGHQRRAAKDMIWPHVAAWPAHGDFDHDRYCAGALGELG